MSKRTQRELFILLLSVFVSTIGLGIMNPLVPQLFSGTHALFPGLGYGIYGLLIAVFPFTQFCSSFVLAAASDRYGRKRLLMLSLAGTAAGYGLIIIALVLKNLPLLFVARAVDGFTGGNMAITQAAVADITPANDRRSRLGLVNGAFGLGLVVGPVLGGTFASSFSLASPFFIAALVASINTFLIWRYLPELPASTAAVTIFRELPVTLWRYISTPRVRHLLSASFLYYCGLTCFNAFFAVFLVERFGFDAEHIGFFYGYVGILYAFNQFVIVPRVNKRLPPRIILLVGVTSLACLMLVYASTFFVPALFVIALAYTFANGTNQANMLGLISTSTDAGEQGRVLGLNNSLFSLAQTILPPLIGATAAGLSAGLPIGIAALFMALSALVLATQVFTKVAKPLPR